MKLLLKILAATAFFATILLAGTLSSCDGETGTSSEPVPFATPEPTPTPEYLVASERKYDQKGVTFNEYTYDERGNMLTSYSTEYNWREYQHLLWDSLLEKTDFSDLGRSVSDREYTYDDQNRVIETKSYFFHSYYDYEGTYHEGEPSESVSYREYDGNIVRYREGDSTRVDEVEYDDLGREVASRYYYDGEQGSERSWVYTQTGNIYIMEQYDEYFYETPLEQGLVHHEERTYDEQGREIKEIRDYMGNGFDNDYYRIEKDYDDAGNLIEERYHNRAGAHWHTKRYTYDEAGRLLTFRQDYMPEALSDASGSGGGMQASQIAPANEFYGYGYNNVYDENGYLIEKTYTTPNDAGVYHSIFYSYDEHGNCIREETRTVGGNLTELIEREFIKLGETDLQSGYVMTLYRRFDEHGDVEEEQTYDAEGRLLTDAQRGFRGETYEYDDAGRVVRVYGSRSGTEYEYDGDERVGREYSSLSGGEKVYGRTTVETLDEQGRVVEQENYRSGEDEPFYTMTYVYTSGDDFVCEEQYIDYAVESIVEQDGLYYMEKTVYDERGRVASTEKYDSTFTGRERTENAYDERGNLVETRHYDHEDFCWRTETYTYDTRNRVLTYRQSYGGSRAFLPSVGAPQYIEDPRDIYGRGADYTYGDDGRLAEMKTLNQWGFPESRTTYTYDEHGNCIREETVDAEGNMTETIEREFTKRGDTE